MVGSPRGMNHCRFALGVWSQPTDRAGTDQTVQATNRDRCEGRTRERLPSLLPRCPNPPRPGPGRPGAQTGRAPRPRPDRRDAHGRRPPSSVHTPSGVRSFRPERVPATRKSSVARLVWFASMLSPPCAGPVCLPKRPQPIRRPPGWIKRKEQASSPFTDLRPARRAPSFRVGSGREGRGPPTGD
jgi:hypothetical protein